MKRVKSPFPWYGGKAAMAPLIASLIPSCRVFVEVFGGAASVLLARTKTSDVEVYNDIDGGLVNFFTQLRENGDELRRLLKATPYSRKECEDCREVVLTGKFRTVSPIEWARCWYVAARQSYGAVLGKASGWAYTKKKSHAKEWRSAVKRIHRVAERLQGVLVDNLDFAEVIRRYDCSDCVFYLDPPYVAGTRAEQNSRNSYRFEMKERFHRVLVDMLLDMKASGILSGYDHSIYDRLVKFGGWSKVTVPARTTMTNRLGTTTDRRKEVLWLSPKIEKRRQRRGILTQ